MQPEVSDTGRKLNRIEFLKVGNDSDGLFEGNDRTGRQSSDSEVLAEGINDFVVLSLAVAAVDKVLELAVNTLVELGVKFLIDCLAYRVIPKRASELAHLLRPRNVVVCLREVAVERGYRALLSDRVVVGNTGLEGTLTDGVVGVHRL